MPRRESETAGGCRALGRSLCEERGSGVPRGLAEDPGRQASGGRSRHGHGVADHRRMGDSGRSIQALRSEAVQRHADPGWLQLRRRRELFASAYAGGLHPRREGALRPVRGSSVEGLPHRGHHGSENRARPGARRGVRLAHLDLGAAAGPNREDRRRSTIISTSTRTIRPIPRAPDTARRTARTCPTCSNISIRRIRRSRSGTRRSRRPWPPTGRTSPSAATPTAKGLPAWPAFSDANPLVMYFSQTPHTGPVPSAERSRCWMRTSRGAGRRKARRGRSESTWLEGCEEGSGTLQAPAASGRRRCRSARHGGQHIAPPRVRLASGSGKLARASWNGPPPGRSVEPGEAAFLGRVAPGGRTLCIG
jgi:hypothetical protein